MRVRALALGLLVGLARTAAAERTVDRVEVRSVVVTAALS
jgi:hypothetical protein